MAEDTLCLHFNVRTLGALQLMLNMTQIISHRFCTLDLNNQTFQRKFLEILAFASFLYQVLRVEMLIASMCVFGRAVFIWQLDMNKSKKRPSGETDDFLTWAIPLGYGKMLKQTAYCTLSQVMCTYQWYHTPCGAGGCSVCGSHCGAAWEAVHVEITFPASRPRRLYFPWMSLNCKQCPYISYEYTRCGPRSVWPEGGVCCAACQTLWYFLRRSDPISGVLWRAASQTARLGLGRWQWHTEAVDFWYPAVTNCEEKVREICSGANS